MWKVRRTLAAAVALVIATAPAPAFAQSDSIDIGHDGWTILAPSQDSRIIYVSSSSGNDSNSGLSESAPKRTLAAGFALLRNGHPDWLLLKSGDTWQESFPFWNRSGRSPSERMVVKSYGSGPRPRLLTGSNNAIHADSGNSTVGIRNLVFADLHLNAHTNPGTAAASGFLIFNAAQNLLIENCYVERYRVNMIFQTYTTNIRQSNIVVRRCIIVDALATNSAHAQGIYADGVDGLVMEENVFDMNGWSPTVPTANIFRHNIYIQTETGGDRGCTNIVTRGNITARASATGFMQRPGGVSEDNLFLQNPIGLQFGYGAGPAVSGVVRNNVFLDSRDISSTTLRGWGMNVTHAQGVEVSRNVVAHQRSGTDNVQAIGIDGTYRNVTVSNNIVYNWNRPSRADGRSLAFFGTPLSGVSVLDNHFQQPQGGFMIGHWAPLGPAFTYAGNRYFSANNGANQFFTNVTYNQWVAQSGESNSSWSSRWYVDPNRDTASYMAMLGQTPSLDAFMTQARRQSRDNWRGQYTAETINWYVREGFGLGRTPCRGDFNSDGTIDLTDVLLFLDFMAQGDPRGDVNEDGLLNIMDYIHYQNMIARGCF
jgi:hypothetical protein